MRAPTYHLPAYAELCCQSQFSFLHGASSPETLVAMAAQLGYEALALTDECSVAGVVRAFREAKQHSIRLIVGSRCVIHGPDFYWEMVFLARTRAGYGQLCQAITAARARAPKGKYLMLFEDLAALGDCLGILLPAPVSQGPALKRAARCLDESFAQRWAVGESVLLHANESAIRDQSLRLAMQHDVPRVAVGQVLMASRTDKPLQDTLTAIGLNRPVSECGHALQPNAQRYLRTRLALAQCYEPSVLAQTCRFVQSCTFDLGSLRYEYPQEIVPSGQEVNAYLRDQTWLGAKYRYPDGIPSNVSQQLAHELQLIADLQYAAYFLTVYDIVSFARRQGILCQGRGSAANSAVCYCLGITEVDPRHGNTLFERFISRERNEPPDIDVDFEHQRREEVIQYIYGRYGHQRAALTAVAITYRPRSALRDVGRALSIPTAVIEEVAKSHAWWESTQALEELLKRVGVDPKDPLMSQWIYLSRAVIGAPRHLSQHPGGFVLSQGPLSALVPIEPASMPNRRVVQWDKDDLDTLGLLKVDVLGLGMLSVIERALRLTALRRDLPLFRMQDIDRHDAATFEMISQADTVGVFQIESRAQMSMLPRLKPRVFYDLVIEVAIVRPGPIQGGMVHPYLRRRQGLEPVTYPSEAVKSVLDRTLGVPIFQEQVMKIAMVAAGFTAEQADSLRRAMAAWRHKQGLDSFKKRLIDGLTANGYEATFAQAIFKQIEGFGEYGFPESHAASFAWLAYVSAWLKCHEPEAFLAALLNSQPMGFYSPSQLIQDATRHGVVVLPVDVQESQWLCSLTSSGTPNPRPAVRLGLNQVKGLAERLANQIVQAQQVGPFLSLTDLTRRAKLSQTALTHLAAAGALAALSAHRRDAIWQSATAHVPEDLLSHIERPDSAPAPACVQPESIAQQVRTDYAYMGYTLGPHPLSLIRAHLDGCRYSRFDVLLGKRPGQLVRACGLVTLRQRPHTARGVMFVTLEDETGNLNVVINPHLIERQRQLILTSQLLGVIGTWQSHDNVNHLLAGRLVNENDLLALLR